MGVFTILLGYAFIYRMFQFDTFLSWQAIQTIFLWLILICVIILLAVSENMKEELRIVIENQSNELKLLREELRRK